MKKILILLSLLLIMAGCSQSTETPVETQTIVNSNGSFIVRAVEDQITAIPLNDEVEAPVTIDIYFDPLCSACQIYGDATREVIQEMLLEGYVQVRYHPLMFLNDYSVDDYSSRASAYIIATAEYAPEIAFQFLESVVSQEFAPADAAVDTTDDSVFTDLLKELGATDAQLELIETNKEKFVTLTVNGTDEFTKDDNPLLELSQAFNEDGTPYIYTPFVMVNQTGALTSKALYFENVDTLDTELRAEVDRVLVEIGIIES